MLKRLRTFNALPRRRKRLLFETSYALLQAKWLVRRKPFQAYAGTLGIPHPGEFIGADDIAEQPLGEVRWALRQVNRLMGGKFTCLMLGIAGKQMLNRRGLANSIVLGVQPGKTEDVAHAWLRAGRFVVVGQEERDGHIPVVSYHSSPVRTSSGVRDLV